jgi:hypothetical protein
MQKILCSSASPIYNKRVEGRYRLVDDDGKILDSERLGLLYSDITVEYSIFSVHLWTPTVLSPNAIEMLRGFEALFREVLSQSTCFRSVHFRWNKTSKSMLDQSRVPFSISVKESPGTIHVHETDRKVNVEDDNDDDEDEEE